MIQKKNQLWIEKNIIAIFVALCFFSFTSAGCIFYLYQFNTNKSGPFGDTVGGIAGPIINVIAALLVYLSFRKQTEANEIIVEQINTDEQRNIMSELSNDIARTEDYFSKIEFINIDNNIQANGLNAIKLLLEHFEPTAENKEVNFTRFNSYLNNHSIGQELLSMLIKCRFIEDNICLMITNEDFKRIADKRLSCFYTFKLYPATKEIFDYARDIILQSNILFNKSIDSTPDTLIIKKIYKISEELKGIMEE